MKKVDKNDQLNEFKESYKPEYKRQKVSVEEL
jgi:hypothetical protein